jgi:hypothetical protein
VAAGADYRPAHRRWCRQAEPARRDHPNRRGLTQATYGGKPLYFYAHEGKHQVLCHNVTEFGGRWLAITVAADPAPI